MKINFVLPTVNMSGGIRVVAIYARMLAQRGHDVVLVSPPQAVKRASLKARLRQLVAWRRPTAAGPTKSHLDDSGLDHRILEQWRPVQDGDLPDADVVIATWWETAEWVAALAPAKGKKVYFVQGHEVFPWLPQERCRATYRLPLRKIAVARWLARVMHEEYEDAAVHVVPNSVDHDQFFAPLRSKQSRPTIGFLCSNVPIKGMDVALHAIELIRKRLPDLRVLSFGNHRSAQALPHFIEFAFDPPQDRLRDLYAACDVWLTASRSEGFNLTAMEAMACRTPVVSTRTGWPEESLINGINGACVAIDDAEGLAAESTSLLELPDASWRRVSQAAFDTVSACSWEKSADLFESALADIAHVHSIADEPAAA
ncbi:MAG: glycosyltransferase family 4 protein [Methylibium sp.]|uniref:glycosyltransferase family 4 protein n=1 Tax=Methylibium sp. TaxID=2067992 RepID=UPI0017DB02D9|nr:glycosyltransferase family 4 protein [Methylibium sp.]MBA3596643.1 glycosyltransferase family 4 protein [Methylibium sp.]